MNFTKQTVLQDLGIQNCKDLTTADVNIIFETHQAHGKQAALSKAKYFIERKNFNPNIVTRFAEPNYMQIETFSKLKLRHEIIIARMLKTGQLEVHTLCTVTNYFFQIKIGVRGTIRQCFAFKKYDYKYMKPHLPVLGPIKNQHNTWGNQVLTINK